MLSITCDGITYQASPDRTITPDTIVSRLANDLLETGEPIGPQIDELAGITGTWDQYPMSVVAAFMELADTIGVNVTLSTYTADQPTGTGPVTAAVSLKGGGFDHLGNWHDPGDGRFAKPGMSTAKRLAEALFRALQYDARHNDNGAIAALTRPIPGVGARRGDRVQARWKSDRLAEIVAGGRRVAVPWAHLTHPDTAGLPDTDRPYGRMVTSGRGTLMDTNDLPRRPVVADRRTLIYRDAVAALRDDLAVEVEKYESALRNDFSPNVRARHGLKPEGGTVTRWRARLTFNGEGIGDLFMGDEWTREHKTRASAIKAAWAEFDHDYVNGKPDNLNPYDTELWDPDDLWPRIFTPYLEAARERFDAANAPDTNDMADRRPAFKVGDRVSRNGTNYVVTRRWRDPGMTSYEYEVGRADAPGVVNTFTKAELTTGWHTADTNDMAGPAITGKADWYEATVDGVTYSPHVRSAEPPTFLLLARDEGGDWRAVGLSTATSEADALDDAAIEAPSADDYRAVPNPTVRTEAPPTVVRTVAKPYLAIDDDGWRHHEHVIVNDEFAGLIRQEDRGIGNRTGQWEAADWGHNQIGRFDDRQAAVDAVAASAADRARERPVDTGQTVTRTSVSAWAVHDLQAKVDKLNQRAERKGLTGRVTLTVSEPRLETDPAWLAAQAEQMSAAGALVDFASLNRRAPKIEVVDVTMSATPVVLDGGWEFAGVVDYATMRDALAGWNADAARSEAIDKIAALLIERGYNGPDADTAAEAIIDGPDPVAAMTAKGIDDTTARRIARDATISPQDMVLLHSAAGYRLPDRFRTEAVCDDCHRAMPRNKLIVAADADGNLTRLGTTCVRDVLGHDPTKLLWWSDAVRELSDNDEAWQGAPSPPSWTHTDYLTLALLAINEFGYTRASEPDSTKSLILGLNGRERESDPPALKRFREIVAAHYASVGDGDDPLAEQAAKIVDYINSDDFSTRDDFGQNMRTAFAGKFVTTKLAGIAAYAPVAYARHQDKVDAAQRAADARADIPNVWVGEIGDKVEHTGVIRKIVKSTNQWGTSSGITIDTPEGTFQTWASGSFADDADEIGEGGTIRFKGTVKDHNEYPSRSGQRQTQLARVATVQTRADRLRDKAAAAQAKLASTRNNVSGAVGWAVSVESSYADGESVAVRRDREHLFQMIPDSKVAEFTDKIKSLPRWVSGNRPYPDRRHKSKGELRDLVSDGWGRLPDGSVLAHPAVVSDSQSVYTDDGERWLNPGPLTFRDGNLYNPDGTVAYSAADLAETYAQILQHANLLRDERRTTPVPHSPKWVVQSRPDEPTPWADHGPITVGAVVFRRDNGEQVEDGEFTINRDGSVDTHGLDIQHDSYGNIYDRAFIQANKAAEDEWRAGRIAEIDALLAEYATGADDTVDGGSLTPEWIEAGPWPVDFEYGARTKKTYRIEPGGDVFHNGKRVTDATGDKVLLAALAHYKIDRPETFNLPDAVDTNDMPGRPLPDAEIDPDSPFQWLINWDVVSRMFKADGPPGVYAMESELPENISLVNMVDADGNTIPTNTVPYRVAVKYGDDRRPVGALLMRKDTGQINMAVDPAHRREGVAQELLAKADNEWGVDLYAQEFTPAGRAAAERYLASKADRNDMPDRPLVGSARMLEAAETIPPSPVADRLTRVWSGDVDSSGPTRGLQWAAAQTFTRPPVGLNPDSRADDQAFLTMAGVNNPTGDLAALYEHTQQHLSTIGIGPSDTVVLYRPVTTAQQAAWETAGRPNRFATTPLAAYYASFADAADAGAGGVFTVNLPAANIVALGELGGGSEITAFAEPDGMVDASRYRSAVTDAADAAAGRNLGVDLADRNDLTDAQMRAIDAQVEAAARDLEARLDPGLVMNTSMQTLDANIDSLGPPEQKVKGYKPTTSEKTAIKYAGVTLAVDRKVDGLAAAERMGKPTIRTPEVRMALRDVASAVPKETEIKVGVPVGLKPDKLHGIADALRHFGADNLLALNLRFFNVSARSQGKAMASMAGGRGSSGLYFHTRGHSMTVQAADNQGNWGTVNLASTPRQIAELVVLHELGHVVHAQANRNRGDAAGRDSVTRWLPDALAAEAAADFAAHRNMTRYGRSGGFKEWVAEAFVLTVTGNASPHVKALTEAVWRAAGMDPAHMPDLSGTYYSPEYVSDLEAGEAAVAAREAADRRVKDLAKMERFKPGTEFSFHGVRYRRTDTGFVQVRTGTEYGSAEDLPAGGAV